VGIGAANKIVIGLFDTQQKEFLSKEFIGDYELANISGNITTKDNEPYLHLHATIADKNLTSYSGHLASALISATCEIIIDSIPETINREFNEEIGLNLLNL